MYHLRRFMLITRKQRRVTICKIYILNLFSFVKCFFSSYIFKKHAHKIGRHTNKANFRKGETQEKKINFEQDDILYTYHSSFVKFTSVVTFFKQCRCFCEPLCLSINKSVFSQDCP